VPPAGVLVSAAAEERRRRADRRRLAAARLGVQVLLPTGLCLLPAFVLLTVVPMVLALLGGA
jgi:tight adherence protein B